MSAVFFTEETRAFLAGVEVKHDAYREWIDAMNGPLPCEPVELTDDVPRIACHTRRPAPLEIPAWSLVQ